MTASNFTWETSVKQVIFCAEMTERLKGRMLIPREKETQWSGGPYVPRGCGCTKTELLADIRHLRRELMELARMIEGEGAR